jgi:hypothetical protein
LDIVIEAVRCLAMEPVDNKPALIAEFSAMRSEITTFITLEVQFLAVSVTFAGVLVGFAVHDWSAFRESLDICPIPFLVLALLYADTKARVLRAACYIQTKLRPQFVEAGLSESLQWEEFIRTEYPARRHLEIIEWLRWLVFLVPAIVTLFLSVNRPPESGGMNLTFFPVLVIIDLAFVVFVMWTIFVLVKQDEKLPPLKSDREPQRR